MTKWVSRLVNIFDDIPFEGNRGVKAAVKLSNMGQHTDEHGRASYSVVRHGSIFAIFAHH